MLWVRQAGRERYIQKFVEYMLREFEAEEAAEYSDQQAAVSQVIGGLQKEEGEEDHRLQRRERVQRCLTLIPEEYWKTVIHLVWSKET